MPIIPNATDMERAQPSGQQRVVQMPALDSGLQEVGQSIGQAGQAIQRRQNIDNKAEFDTAMLQIEELGAGLDLFHLEVGRYPTTEEGLEALVAEPVGVNRWNGPYLKKKTTPKDPWGNDYFYSSPGEHGMYDLYSLGQDNMEGGEDEKADVVSW